MLICGNLPFADQNGIFYPAKQEIFLLISPVIPKGAENLESKITARSELTSDVLKLLQYSSFFENSCKIILEKLSAFAGTPVASIAVVSGETLTSYEYTAQEEKLFSFKNKLSESRDGLPAISDNLRLSGIAYRDVNSCSRGCYQDFDKMGWTAALVHAVKIDGRISAFIILCDDNKEREWSNDVIAAVCDFGKVVSGLFQSKTTQEELERTNLTFKTVVDNIDSYVYVTETKSGKIIFTNEKLRSMFNENIIGKLPGELFGEDFANLHRQYSQKGEAFEFFFEKTKQWFDVSVSLISWVNNESVRLTTLNDISDKVEYERRIETQIYYDLLTGLPNRRHLEKDFNGFVESSREAGKSSYVLFIDLDDFKNINDAKGHSYGDLHLKEVANLLRSYEKTGVVPYRFGGDEFIMIVPANCEVDADSILESLKVQFNQEWDVNGNTYYCTASIGVAEFPKEDDNYTEVMKRVDMALLYAKKNGKNNISTYQSGIGNEILRKIEIKRSLRNDISNGFKNFEVHYQPIINSDTQKLEGCEALLRWSCDALGRVSPGEFIPIAEENGYISDLGEFVLRQASTQCKKWIDEGFDIKVNVNLSVGQLSEPNFLEKIKKVLQETEAPYTNLTLEVTESMAMNDIKKMKELLGNIADLGICIALDDFGTGYSSLNCLKEMPLSTIKIDKTFIDDIVGNPYTAMFVKTIVNLSHDLKMRVCAEGVEEKEQFELLKGLKTDVIQGFYFGRPISSQEFEEKFLYSDFSLALQEN